MEEGNDDNSCKLTDRRLIIRRRNKLYEYPIQGIRSLGINHRKLLIPIVFGGVFTPLIAVGFFEGFFHPVIAVILIISGVFTFYLGWTGQQVLTVNESQGHSDFPVENPGENMAAFIEFTNQFIENEPLEFRSLYLMTGNENRGPKIGDPPVVLYTFRQIKDKLMSGPQEKDVVIWAIDPLNTGTEIKYERFGGDPGLRPVLKGKIKPEAFTGKYTWQEFMEISPEK
jgi:hypothetical protein